jgi:citrate lyase synthetase
MAMENSVSSSEDTVVFKEALMAALGFNFFFEGLHLVSTVSKRYNSTFTKYHDLTSGPPCYTKLRTRPWSNGAVTAA